MARVATIVFGAWFGLICFAFPSAHAAPVKAKMPFDPSGVWRGTVGQREVMLQINAPCVAGGSDSLYWLDNPSGIFLLADDDSKNDTWLESKHDPSLPSGTWYFSKRSDTTMQGAWQSVDGQRFPIRLKLIHNVRRGADGRPQCDGDEQQRFYAPRLARLKSEVIKQSLNGHEYRLVSVLNGSLSRVDIDSLPNLTRMLRESLEVEAIRYFDCELADSSYEGRKGHTDYYVNLEPTLWKANVLVLQRTYSAYCGGNAHPSAGVSGYITWDVQHDRAFDVQSWVRGMYRGVGGYQLPDELLALTGIPSSVPGDDECFDLLQSVQYFVRPTDQGLGFDPSSLPHAAQACGGEVVIPYDKLQPFLTEEGRQAVDALLSAKE